MKTKKKSKEKDPLTQEDKDHAMTVIEPALMDAVEALRQFRATQTSGGHEYGMGH